MTSEERRRLYNLEYNQIGLSHAILDLICLVDTTDQTDWFKNRMSMIYQTVLDIHQGNGGISKDIWKKIGEARAKTTPETKLG